MTFLAVFLLFFPLVWVSFSTSLSLFSSLCCRFHFTRVWCVCVFFVFCQVDVVLPVLNVGHLSLLFFVSRSVCIDHVMQLRKGTQQLFSLLRCLSLFLFLALSASASVFSCMCVRVCALGDRGVVGTYMCVCVFCLVVAWNIPPALIHADTWTKTLLGARGTSAAEQEIKEKVEKQKRTPVCLLSMCTLIFYFSHRVSLLPLSRSSPPLPRLGRECRRSLSCFPFSSCLFFQVTLFLPLLFSLLFLSCPKLLIGGLLRVCLRFGCLRLLFSSPSGIISFIIYCSFFFPSPLCWPLAVRPSGRVALGARRRTYTQTQRNMELSGY